MVAVPFFYCKRNKCNGWQCLMYEISILSGYVILAILFIVIMNSLSDEHYPLKILFFSSSLFSFLMGISVAVVFTSPLGSLNAILQNNYIILMWVIIFVLFYIIIYFTVQAIKQWKINKDMNKFKWGFANE